MRSVAVLCVVVVLALLALVWSDILPNQNFTLLLYAVLAAVAGLVVTLLAWNDPVQVWDRHWME